MKHLSLMLVVVFSVLFLQSAVAENSVGVVDLITVTSLHPKMSLFDFGKLGFLRVSPGSTEQAKILQLEQIRSNPMAIDQHREIIQEKTNNLERLKTLDSEIRMALKIRDKTLNRAESYRMDVEIASMGAQLDNLKMIDRRFQRILESPEITTPRETIEIFKAIEVDVLAAVKRVADEANLDLVFNASNPSWSFQESLDYLTGPTTGLGIAGIQSDLFFSVLARGSSDEEGAKSAYALQWVELMRHPLLQRVLPVRPQPLVLKGGIDITPKVVDAILADYQIDATSRKAIRKVLKGRSSNL